LKERPGATLLIMQIRSAVRHKQIAIKRLSAVATSGQGKAQINQVSNLRTREVRRWKPPSIVKRNKHRRKMVGRTMGGGIGKAEKENRDPIPSGASGW